MGMPNRILAWIVALPAGCFAAWLVWQAFRAAQYWPGLLGVIYLLAVGRFLYLFRPQLRRNFTVLDRSASGEVQIMHAALVSLVHRAAKEMVGLGEVRVDLKNAGDGVKLVLRVDALTSARAVGLGEALQAAARRQLEEKAGVKVKEVRVVVETVKPPADTPRTRVR
ncbi:MAG: alkaline shock response membrane anchor protein AmaP [Heliobacteriaceae bacterium]|nr:alkaline shock response membrane anchor protein AmaP [Heliobacteriaceae bacterium]MDD4587209.1 alkaline shock response membrane anchor protein AmaP [Heliobacteriaceae bacterium]